MTEPSQTSKAEITVESIIADPMADVLAHDPKAPTNDSTVPRADSHDPRPGRN